MHQVIVEFTLPSLVQPNLQDGMYCEAFFLAVESQLFQGMNIFCVCVCGLIWSAMKYCNIRTQIDHNVTICHIALY